MSFDDLPGYIRFLLDPAAYPHAVERVRLQQTHISYILLAGDSVYKFKKPMDFGFLDFTSLERRKFFCEQELVLNRRLCPTIYIDLVAVRDTAAGPALVSAPQDGAAVIEYGVHMRRMPQERMMGEVIRRGELHEQHLVDIVAKLVPFYAKADAGPHVTRLGTADAVGVTVRGNLQQAEPFVGCPSLSRAEYDAIWDYNEKFLRNTEVFAARMAAGRVRDCHGDLHSGNICLADDVYIYDCIEFNHRFRYIDVACDIAFLAMDLDYHGLHPLSASFVKTFRDRTGDETLGGVLNFYKCYRASVRGKIGLLTAHEPEMDEETRREALRQATRYFVLAQRYAESG